MQRSCNLRNFVQFAIFSPGLITEGFIMQKSFIFLTFLGTFIFYHSGIPVTTPSRFNSFTGTAVTKPHRTSIIPPDMKIDWAPGIPGGIPEVDGPVADISDYGADPTGYNDCKNAVMKAMDALPPTGGIVLFPPGTFRIGSGVRIERDRIVFRGNGGNSRLFIASRGNSIEVSRYERGQWQELSRGAGKGTISLEVEDGGAFTAGGFAEIEQDNDSVLMYTDPRWIQPWSGHSVGQVFEIAGIEGNRLTFSEPVNIDFSAVMNARIRPMGLVRYVGFEDLYIEKTSPHGSTIAFMNTAYCWIRNIESCHTRRSHVQMTACLNNEVRDSYFHRSYSYGGGGSGYGVECGRHVTNTLVENNIFDSLRHAMLVQMGANGNVYGYNYSAHPVQGDGETGLNKGWSPPDISVHGHYAFMNLFEGNDVEEIGIADYWGPAGPGNTCFRNRVRGEGILIYDKTCGQNLVGNVATLIKDRDREYSGTLRHGNVIRGKPEWDPGIAARELPKSYYWRTRPDFFRDSAWPCYGPDIRQYNELPAQNRFRSMQFPDEL